MTMRTASESIKAAIHEKVEIRRIENTKAFATFLFKLENDHAPIKVRVHKTTREYTTLKKMAI